MRRGSRAITQAGVAKKRKEQPFGKDVAFNIIQSVPLVGQIASSIAYSSNPVPVLNSINDLVEGVGTAVKGKQKGTKIKGAVQAAGALGSMAGASWSITSGSNNWPENKDKRIEY